MSGGRGSKRSTGGSATLPIVARSDPERRRPLPGLLELPRFLVGQLSRRGRLTTYLAAAAGAAGLAIAAIVLIPEITETKKRTAEQERRELARSQAAERARLIREQRPRIGVVSATSPSAARAGLELFITADARRRFRTPAKHTDCRYLDTAGRVRRLSCTAVTTAVAGGGASRAIRIGYPYRAKVDLRDGGYGFCRVSGRPGEGALGLGQEIALPTACGG